MMPSKVIAVVLEVFSAAELEAITLGHKKGVIGHIPEAVKNNASKVVNEKYMKAVKADDNAVKVDLWNNRLEEKRGATSKE
eukprot:15252884-Ditylum_brightwellii.AAC.1